MILSHFHSWRRINDEMIPNNMAEFRDNGVTHLVWCNCWCGTDGAREACFWT